jgi:mannosylglycerate hydrolase
VSNLTFHLIPHTHWDREWYLPRAQFGARLIPVIDDVIALLERDSAIPGFLLDGQTVLLEDYLRVRPEQEEAVRRLVRSGRIETGPWYVLADEQIPSGESLIRNLLLGKADTDRWGGGMRVLYSPDAFGHPAMLPGLARQFGIDTGVAWRGIDSDRDLFRWQAPDGAELVLYHLPPDGYEIGSSLSSLPGRTADSWKAIRDTLTARAAGRHVAVFVGADHHAARPDLRRLAELIAHLEPANEVRLSRLGDFMALARETRELPSESGEMRAPGHTWTLQGVHATRAHQKRRNSRAELWLERYAEPLAALGRRAGRERKPLLTAAWRSLVQCHFHDAIAGCASDAVAREVDTRLAEVEGVTREIVRGSLQDVWRLDPDQARERSEAVRPSLLLWNPAPRPREGIVLGQVTVFRRDILVGPPGGRVPRENEPSGFFALETAAGERIPVQILETIPALERLDAARHYPDQDEVDLVRIAFESPPVAGLAGEVLTLTAGQPIPAWGSTEAMGNRLSNEHVAIELSEDGSLKLLDRRSGERRSGMLRLESEPDLGDTYSFAPSIPARITGATLGPIQVLASGPMVAALTASLTVGEGRVAAELLLFLLRDDPVIRCTLRIDNRAGNHRLRVRFPAHLPGPAIAGAQFGSISRPAVRASHSPRETPVLTAPAHRFLGLARDTGFALLAPGFFEYELGSQGDVVMTVLRAVDQLSRNDLSTRPGHAGWPTATPLAQCLGEESVDFALLLGGPECRDPVYLHRTWEDVFLPLKAAWFRDWNGIKAGDPSGIELTGEGLALSAIKPAERSSGIVLRCYNLTAEPVEGMWRFGFTLNRVQRARADETPVAVLTLEDAGRAVRFVAEPHEMVTIIVSGE